MAGSPERVDPRTDPAVRFWVLEIVDDQLDQSWPELAEDLKARVEDPEVFGPPVVAELPAEWLIDWGDVARLALLELEAADPPLVERVEKPVEGMPGDRAWPAAARRFRLTPAGEAELERQRT